VGSVVDSALFSIDTIIGEILAAAVKERPAKRPRRASSKGVKNQAATGALEQPGEAKRMKTNSQSEETPTFSPGLSDSSNSQQTLIEKALQQIEAVLPRVGKKQINSPNILQMLNAIFPKYQIVRVLAGKGTDRRFEPPSDINPEEAPYRRSIIRLRKDQQIILDPAWEKYDNLSKRQIIRQSPACRVNITMFAAVKAEDQQSPMPSSETVPEAESPDQPAADDGTANPEILNMKNPENQMNENPSAEDPNQVDSDVVEKPEAMEKNQRPPSAVPPAIETPSSIGLERHGPRFRALPKEEQAMIKRAHQNLCHPSPEQLSAVFRSKGCRPEICQAVFDMQCSTCAACQKPKVARPSTLKDALDFNDKVFIDGITWTSKAGTMFHFYHLNDQATNYHVAIPAPSRSADQAINKVSESWFLWAGPPNTLIMDSATEFTSEAFGEFLQRHDVRGVVTSPHAHWQNGRCERHGQILQSMLNKIDIENPITTYKDLQQALIQCTHAKNTLSIRAGFAPEVLVFGKNSKLPGSNISSDEISAHASANSEDAQGIAFRQNLALREKARIAYHQVDNDMALRRACLRRTRPDRQSYSPGEWIMMWQPQKDSSGYWFGPLKVIQQDKNLYMGNSGGKLHRRAPEHARPVSSAEARQVPLEEIPIEANQGSVPPDVQTPEPVPNELPAPRVQGVSRAPSEHNSSQSQDQPDNEPEGESSENVSNDPNANQEDPTLDNPMDTQVPEIDDSDDSLITSHLLCCDDEEPILNVDLLETPYAWRFEMEVPTYLTQQDRSCMAADDILLATADKRQRTEVKLSTLNAEEKAAFQKAKETEVQNWLTTGTVSRILRSKLAPEQIMRCRWLLVWKDKDPDQVKESAETSMSSKLRTHKAKARLVVLGYLDPNLTEVPRDSPTLGRQSKMLLLQLITSCGWTLESFDIRAAFLQGRTQQDQFQN
jgi:transposase InsO family protein